MNTYPSAAVAEEHRSDLLRAAGCCTGPAHASPSALPVLGRRLTLRLRRGSARQPIVCGHMRTARIDGDTALVCLSKRGRLCYLSCWSTF
jgi:hypothetical protein